MNKSSVSLQALRLISRLMFTDSVHTDGAVWEERRLTPVTLRTTGNHRD